MTTVERLICSVDREVAFADWVGGRSGFKVTERDDFATVDVDGVVLAAAIFPSSPSLTSPSSLSVAEDLTVRRFCMADLSTAALRAATSGALDSAEVPFPACASLRVSCVAQGSALIFEEADPIDSDGTWSTAESRGLCRRADDVPVDEREGVVVCCDVDVLSRKYMRNSSAEANLTSGRVISSRDQGANESLGARPSINNTEEPEMHDEGSIY